MTKEMICITCPVGCSLTVTQDETGAVLSVSGNHCPRGDAYARAELTHPVRMVTSTVRISGSIYPRLPVITTKPVPKEKIRDVMHVIDGIEVKAPVAIGEILAENIAGTGADLAAERTMRQR